MTSPAPQPASRPGLFGWIAGHVRALLMLLLAGVMVTGGLIYTGILGIDQLDEEIRARVEAKLAGQYPHLRVKVESARIKKGQGIQINGISIADPQAEGDASQLAYIDQVLASCDTSLQELITHEPHFTSFTIYRPRWRIVRRADGTWNSDVLLPLPRSNRAPCPTTILDAVVEILDPATNAGRPLVLKNLELCLAPDDSPEALACLPESQSRVPLRITGSLACDHFRKLSVDGWLDAVGGAWALKGEIDQLVITPALEDSLPLELPTRLLKLHDLHGKLSLQYEITNQGLADAAHDFPVRFALVGKLQEARLDDRRLPHPLTELSAHLYCNDEGGHLQEISARCGAARVYMSLEREGWSASAPMTLKGRVVKLALDSALAEALNEKQRAVWDRFLPTGAVHADFVYAFDGERWRHDITAELLQVSVAYDKFSYRVSGAGGKVRLANDYLSFDTFATAGRQKISCRGELHTPGPDFTGWVDIASETPIAIDERLLLAFDERTQATLRALAPQGNAQFHFRIDRERPDEPVEPYLHVAVTEAAIRYDKFRYPLDRIRGQIFWRKGAWTFEQFEGYHDNAYVLASGDLTRDARGEQYLRLRFACADVPLEENLKRALPEHLQSVWTSLSPAGALDQLNVAIDYHCDRRALSIDVQGQKHVRPQIADPRGISLSPSWLKYRIDHLTGGFHYRDGDLVLRSWKGQHGPTRIAGDARCQMNPDGGWHVAIDRLHVDRLEIDHELLTALPTTARELLTKWKLRGPLHLAGSGSLTNDGAASQPTSATWDVTIDLENGGIDAGAPLEHIHGGVRLKGQADRRGWSTHGELAVDSVMVQGVQLTQLSGPLACDGARLLLGGYVSPAGAPTRAPRSLTAKVFDGSLSADAALTLDEDGAFETQVTLTDADLARIAADIFSPRSKISGKAQGYLKLAGNNKGRHTYQGGGVVRLREADIYELPVMVALLKILSIREPDKTAFNTADLDFRIQGEHIYVDRVDFVGDAITLKGTGEMDWQRQLKLQFYTMVGRDEVQLPVLRPLLGEASRNLMLITVGGTLEQPVMRREALPRLNETLQQIFPEARIK